MTETLTPSYQIYPKLRTDQSLELFEPWSHFYFIETIETYTIDQDFLYGDLDERYRLREAVPVFVERSDDTYTVYWQDIEAFGCGSTPEKAFQDLKAAIVELFDRLAEEPFVSLSPQLRADLSKLETLIEHK